MFGNGVSLADIAAVTGNNGGNGNNGWGDGNGWWVLIILFALFGGWGRGGYGNQGGCGSEGSGYVDAAIQRGFDNQGVTNKLNGLENGICSLGYDQLAQMNNLSTQILQTGYATQTQLQNCCCNLENAVQANTVANMQNANAAAMQLQQCCCNIENLLQQANYNRASDTCAITTAIDRMGDRIVANDNNNFRALYDQQVALQMQAKDQQIAAMQRQLTSCDTQNMINASAQYITQTLQPTAKPGYIVPNPNTGYYFPFGYFPMGQQNCCNSGCCGNGWNGWNGNF